MTNMMDDFLAQMKAAGGFARQNRYEVVIPVSVLRDRSLNIFKANNAILEYADVEAIDWVNDFYDADLKNQEFRLTAFCEESELPSMQFQMETNRHYGVNFKIPHSVEYQDITMTFMCGNDMLERYFFDTWMYLVMDPETNNANYIDEYALDIDIIQYSEANYGDNTGVVNYYTTLAEAYPIAINSQKLGYAINNTIQTVQVTFTYKYPVPYYGKGSTTGRALRGDRRNMGQIGAPGGAIVSLTPQSPPPQQ